MSTKLITKSFEQQVVTAVMRFDCTYIISEYIYTRESVEEIKTEVIIIIIAMRIHFTLYSRYYVYSDQTR